MRAKTLFESFTHACNGLSYTFKTQRNFRIHSIALVFLILVLYWLRLSTVEAVLLLSAAFLVLIAELINTAVEKTIDLYTTRIHPLARIAKNCAAAAVLLSALYSVLVAILIIAPKIFRGR